MIYYHPKWLQQPFLDEQGNFMYQLDSQEVKELQEILMKFLSFEGITRNRAQIIAKLR